MSIFVSLICSCVWTFDARTFASTYPPRLSSWSVAKDLAAYLCRRTNAYRFLAFPCGGRWFSHFRRIPDEEISSASMQVHLCRRTNAVLGIDFRNTFAYWMRMRGVGHLRCATVSHPSRSPSSLAFVRLECVHFGSSDGVAQVDRFT